MTLQSWAKLVSLWVVEQDQFLLLRTENTLELKGEERLLKSLLIGRWDEVLALSPYFSEESFHITACFVD